MDLPTESRLIVLMQDLEGLSDKLAAAVAGIAHEARLIAIAAREMDLENELRPDLCYRLEQWDSDSLARTISATSHRDRRMAGSASDRPVVGMPLEKVLLARGYHRDREGRIGRGYVGLPLNSQVLPVE
jgi:hypothetical protein